MRAFGLLIIFAGLLAASPAAAEGEARAQFPAPIEQAFAEAKRAMMEDPTEVLQHTDEAEALAGRLTDDRQRILALATAKWLAAEARLRRNEAEAADKLLTEALRLIQPIKEKIKLRGDLLMSQGAYFMQRDQASQALANFLEAMSIFRAVGEKRSQAIAYQNIGALYSAANDDSRAEQYYAEAAATYSGDPLLSLALHNSRGNVLLVLERYAEAESEYMKALEIARQNGNPLLEGRVLGNLARTQVEARKLDAAERTLKRGFELTRGADVKGFRQQLLATAARVAMEKGDLRRAKRLIVQAFDGVDVTKTSVAFREAHRFAYMIFSQTGEPALALRHLEALKRVSDQAAKVATTYGAALMAAKFNYADQKLKIADLQAEELRKSAEYERTIFLGVGGATLALLTVLSIALLVVRRSRNEVRAANVVLGDTNVALEKALKAKTEFLATTSHEIRTPLNGILGMTQVMLADSKVDGTIRDRIGIVHGAGITMRALVDDILDVAKMETGNMTVEQAPFDLTATLREVTRMWEEQARAKGLTFELNLTHAPQWIVGDAGRMRQIVFNLLSNAIKFTERGSVGVRAVAEGEGDARRLRLTVSDSGIGIPEDKRGEIFESFRQVDAGTTRKFGGTGLGLTICRNLAQALGGDITVESREGEGSRFIVDLPLVAAEAPEAAVQAENASGAILVLDRNPITRSMIRTLLEPRVSAVRFVGSVDEAISVLAEGDVTDLIADEATLKANEADADAEIARLVAACAAPAVRATLLWAKPDDATRERILDAGISIVIDKPVSGPVLIEAIVSDAKENLDKSGSVRLVTRAA